MIKDIITIACMVIGTFFMVVGAFGVVRMPDLYMRMSASAKSSTLGVMFMLLAAAIYFADDLGVAARALAVIAFVFLTAPVAAHMIGRAGYLSGAQLWEKSVVNDLDDRYEEDILLSMDQAKRKIESGD